MLINANFFLLVFQLKEVIEKLPPEISEGETFKAMYARAEAFLNMVETSKTSSLPTSQEKANNLTAPNNGSTPLLDDSSKRIEDNVDASGMKDLTQENVNNLLESKKTSANTREAVSQSSENGSRSPAPSTPTTEGEKQVIEQFEPGVYVTLVVLSNGAKIFKRVRFRYLKTVAFERYHSQMHLEHYITSLLCATLR